MLTGVGNVSVKPLVTVGDVLPGGIKFEGIPDGIAIDPTGKYVAVADQGNVRIVLFSLPEIMNHLAMVNAQK